MFDYCLFMQQLFAVIKNDKNEFIIILWFWLLFCRKDILNTQMEDVIETIQQEALILPQQILI